MPKPSQYILIWSEEQQCYQLTIDRQFHNACFAYDESSWSAWVQTVGAFAFEGRNGHLSVVKEARQRGAGYWYAYSRQGGRTKKKYLGRSPSLAQLEEVALELVGEKEREIVEAEVVVNVERQPVSLLGTKVLPPQLPMVLVERERLLRELDVVWRQRLGLVSAAAGSGKTTLLAEWALQRRAEQRWVAWLSLDVLDNDVRRFWTLVVEALRACRPEVGTQTLALLQGVAQPVITAVLTTLINELSFSQEEIVLVLDDYHVITDQGVQDAFNFLLQHQPANLHIIMVTRIDPDLPLPRMRVRGQLIEIRDGDLRFRCEETSRFLEGTIDGVLTEDEIHVLQGRTEGWIAGLQLAALALRKQDERANFLQAYAGNHRHVLDYIQQEILSRQAEEVQQFVLRSAVLPRMSAALCEAVTGEVDSQRILEMLERSNLFVVPLDERRQWYRFHDLFREALLSFMQNTQAEVLPELYERAARWYEGKELWTEAIEAALQARAFHYATGLIERMLVPQRFGSAYRQLRRWLESVPAEVLSPSLNLAYAEAIVFTSDRSDPSTQIGALEPLRKAEQGFRAEKNRQKLSHVLSMQATIAFWRNDLPAAFALAHQMLKEQPAGEMHWRGSSLLLLGMEEMLGGKLEDARQRMLVALAVYRADQSLPGILGAFLCLGDIALVQGEMQQAKLYYQQVLADADGAEEDVVENQLTSKKGTKDIVFTRLALEGLARLAYESNELEDAERLHKRAWAMGKTPVEAVYFLTSPLWLQVAIPYAQRQIEVVRERLDALVVQAQSPHVLREVDRYRARIALAMGELSKVEEWSRMVERIGDAQWLVDQEETALLHVRMRIAQGECEEALQLLAPWKKGAEVQKRVRSLMEMQLLEALAYAGQERLVEARELMMAVLTRAKDEGYQRLLLDEGEGVWKLLKYMLAHIEEKALVGYVRDVLRVFEQELAGMRSDEVEEFLSPQEQRVLHLLVNGYSNPEMAEVLVVSVNTIKAHMKNLYRKLDVTNRVQAVEVARRKQLI